MELEEQKKDSNAYRTYGTSSMTIRTTTKRKLEELRKHTELEEEFKTSWDSFFLGMIEFIEEQMNENP